MTNIHLIKMQKPKATQKTLLLFCFSMVGKFEEIVLKTPKLLKLFEDPKAEQKFTCISCAMDSLSERISPKFLIPSTFLKVLKRFQNYFIRTNLSQIFKTQFDAERFHLKQKAVFLFSHHFSLI